MRDNSKCKTTNTSIVNFLSNNLAWGAILEVKRAVEFASNISIEHSKLNAKYGSLKKSEERTARKHAIFYGRENPDYIEENSRQIDQIREAATILREETLS